MIGGALYSICQTKIKKPEIEETDSMDRQDMHHKDMREEGISWGTQKNWGLNVANLNNVHKPYSAPRQEETYNLDDIFTDQAGRQTFASTYAPKFFFRDNTEIPLTTAAAGTYNVELPSRASIRGDPGGSMGKLPRSYVDNEKMSWATQSDTWGANGASEPEIFEEVYVPMTGQLNQDMNPYGPGGVVQRLNNRLNAGKTRRLGVNRDVILAPSFFRST